ncbi:hypothetical protein IDSA_10770 [Pseudidiomarina salinarum]|uniref:Type II secretion system protein GspB C-terminal domain-containing protein n=1 Tax=Pseudidiomarina salinarum TaxID=435908 RepID=A0A094L680_9GAMM|nr:general secretion pathway protein GspB [Pseudidiomarina salinarum]KFZ30233.1 hypothetical protein IDSA_10770 [Pseudidiomarina salinarum]RUO69932.1 general secretion pathway protein GspB [Pseudidiomarina salinarum]
MSSVLKALRNQSSPLLQERPPVWLSSAVDTSPGRSWRWLALALVVVAAGIGGWLLADRQTQEVITEPVVTTVASSRYQLGAIPQVRQPTLPAAVAEASSQPAVMQSRGAEQPALPQAINLNDVSPELLNAFEDAVAATDGDDAGRNSVVPDLRDLDLSFQRSIPAFTYDGHQYSSRDSSRWVVLGGNRLFEGDSWQGLTVVRIAPAYLVLSKNYQAFQQPALEDWTSP